MNERDMQGSVAGRANARERGDQNKKIFIGGVPKTVLDDEYREYFGSFGVLDDHILMRDQDGICRGFGFITYRDQAAYDQVMQAQLQLRGKPLEQKKAVPRKQLATGQQKTKIKIFVGGLAPNVDNNLLYEHFSQYGEVIDSIVMMDAETGNSRGFGFVTFSDPAVVEEVMKTPRFELLGKSVECKRARPLSMMTRQGGRGGGARRVSGRGRYGDFGGRPIDVRELGAFDTRYGGGGGARFDAREDRYGFDSVGGGDRYNVRGRYTEPYNEAPVVYPNEAGYRREMPRYEEPYRSRQPVILDPWTDRPSNSVPIQPQGDIYEYRVGGSVDRFRPY